MTPVSVVNGSTKGLPYGLITKDILFSARNFEVPESQIHFHIPSTYYRCKINAELFNPDIPEKGTSEGSSGPHMENSINF